MEILTVTELHRKAKRAARHFIGEMIALNETHYEDDRETKHLNPPKESLRIFETIFRERIADCYVILPDKKLPDAEA